MKIIATNRKAKRDYKILDTFEAGIVLKGDEIKSLRMGNCSLDEGFARVEGQELFLYNMHISEFPQSSFFKTEPKRIRKLLVHKKEIIKLFGLTTQKGITLVPLKAYFNERGIVKLEMALARGRQFYDKRRKLKEDIAKREAERAVKRFYKKGFKI